MSAALESIRILPTIALIFARCLIDPGLVIVPSDIFLSAGKGEGIIE
jgi:hypothetical protein